MGKGVYFGHRQFSPSPPRNCEYHSITQGETFFKPQLASLCLGWSARNFTAFFETANCAILQPAFLGLQNPWQNIWPTPWHCKENGSLEVVLFGWGQLWSTHSVADAQLVSPSHFIDFLLKGKILT